MTAQHATGETIELYVLGALDRRTSARLEQHVRVCAPCAAALGNEARLEMELRQLVPLAPRPEATVVRLCPPPAPPAAARRLTFPAAWAAVVALVAGLGTVQMSRLGAEARTRFGAAVPAREGQEPALVCERGADELLCAGPAAEHGMVRMSRAAEGSGAAVCQMPGELP